MTSAVARSKSRRAGGMPARRRSAFVRATVTAAGLVASIPRLQDPTCRALDYPLGSGMVAGANKVVVQAHLKASGLPWAPRHVDPRLAVRTLVGADRWDDAWPRVVRRWQAADRGRRQRAAQRRAALSSAAPCPHHDRRRPSNQRPSL